MSGLPDVLAGRRVSFAEFMELALYHPEHGYYTRPREGGGPVGAQGDFITAPSASPLFARTVAGILRALATRRGPLTLVELGAGEGLFLQGLSQALGDGLPDVLGRIVAVEAGAWARERIRPGDVEVAASLASVSGPSGPVVIFASELYDALPARLIQVVRRGRKLLIEELFVVGDGNGRLGLVAGAPTDGAVERYLEEHGLRPEEGQRLEIRPQAREMHRRHLQWAGEEGIALVVDYGYPSRQLYGSRARLRGTLVGYRDHQLVRDVLESPGEVDITAHVNFDDLDLGAADAGWDRGSLHPLGAFLTLHGALSHLPEATATGERLTAAEWSELAAAKRLLLPSGMGTDLKVLTQGRGPLWHTFQELETPPPLDA